jgi:hypothetical protein
MLFLFNNTCSCVPVAFPLSPAKSAFLQLCAKTKIHDCVYDQAKVNFDFSFYSIMEKYMAKIGNRLLKHLRGMYFH